jgi:hypothetical protein
MTICAKTLRGWFQHTVWSLIGTLAKKAKKEKGVHRRWGGVVHYLPGCCAISVCSILDSPTDKKEATDERNVDEIPYDHSNVKMDLAMF